MIGELGQGTRSVERWIEVRALRRSLGNKSEECKFKATTGSGNMCMGKSVESYEKMLKDCERLCGPYKS